MKDKAVEIFRDLQVQLFEAWTRGSREASGGAGNAASNGEDRKSKRRHPEPAAQVPTPASAPTARNLAACSAGPEALTPAETVAPPDPERDSDGASHLLNGDSLSSTYFDFGSFDYWTDYDDEHFLESYLAQQGGLEAHSAVPETNLG